MAAGKSKGYKASDRIIIENPKTGEMYGVTGSAFEKNYEGIGFRAVSLEDGTPLSLSKDEAEAASRAAAPATVNVGPAGIPPAPAPEKAPARRARSSGTRSSGARNSGSPEPAPASSPEA